MTMSVLTDKNTRLCNVVQQMELNMYGMAFTGSSVTCK